MQALWRSGKATVTEVHQALQARGSNVAYTTVQTMLNRLDTKGLVARDSSERSHRYRPLLKEPIATVEAIRRLTDRFLTDQEALAMQLVEKELSEEQLERIQRNGASNKGISLRKPI